MSLSIFSLTPGQKWSAGELWVRPARFREGVYLEYLGACMHTGMGNFVLSFAGDRGTHLRSGPVVDLFVEAIFLFLERACRQNFSWGTVRPSGSLGQCKNFQDQGSLLCEMSWIVKYRVTSFYVRFVGGVGMVLVSHAWVYMRNAFCHVSEKQVRGKGDAGGK